MNFLGLKVHSLQKKFTVTTDILSITERSQGQRGLGRHFVKRSGWPTGREMGKKSFPRLSELFPTQLPLGVDVSFPQLKKMVWLLYFVSL